MKPNTSHQKAGQWATFSVIALSSANLLFATPQSAPSGESEIGEFIQMDISADKRLQGAEMNVRIENGIAIISGTAKTLAQTERASARAIASDGVNVVLNQVGIVPESSSNIVEKAKAALRKQKIFRADQVVVTANGSRVSLAGKVGVLDEKDLAREIVSEIPGVTAIDNDLTVTFEGIREDAQIAEQLHFLIKDDPLYEGLDLTATVKSGTVSLSGEVGSRGEYDRLVRRSYVTGIIDVQISGLSINSDLAMEGLADKEYSQDQSLEALKAALAIDSRINANLIETKMADGVITLKGSVGQIAESDAVETTARGIPGVLRVENELKIVRGGEIAGTNREFKSASAPPLMKPRR
ncbi:MAG: BON domain-containing protein [Verrucomicrobiota bacterium]